VFTCVVFGFFPFFGNDVVFWTSVISLIYGIIMIVSAVKSLGPENITPFPEPTNTNELVTAGVYSAVRHPMCKERISPMIEIFF